jgi:DNA-binding transcriptional MerR regulator
MTKANLKRLDEGKLYYSISEVCAMTGLEQHVLRYWESEFPQLRPKKNRSGNRAYRTKEIKIIRYIKYLLYEEMYTIPGAKKKMADANMSDLEGQLTLIRVPAAPVREQAHIAVQESTAQAVPLEQAVAIAEPPMDIQDSEDETPEAPDVHPVAAHHEDSFPAQGGEAYAKLREELRRVKQELQELLSALAASGKGIP